MRATPPLATGGGPGSRRVALPAGGASRGWGVRSAQPPLGRSRGGEAGPRENERASGGIPPPLPEGAAPRSEAARLPAELARMNLRRGSKQVRGLLGNSALLAGRADNSRSRWPPQLPPGAAPGCRDSRAIGLWSRPPPPPHSGEAFFKRHHERADPMEGGPVREEALQETRISHWR